MLTGAGPGGESVASTSKVTGSAWAAATCIADNAATNDRQKARGKRCLNKLWTKPLQSLANTRTGSDEIPFTLPPLNLSVVDCESTARTGCTVRLQIAFQASAWQETSPAERRRRTPWCALPIVGRPVQVLHLVPLASDSRSGGNRALPLSQSQAVPLDLRTDAYISRRGLPYMADKQRTRVNCPFP
jgi:hypothetical protein